MIVIIVIIAIIIIIIAAVFLNSEPPERKCGRLGEEYAARMIESILNGKDHLLSNITVSFDQKNTELDNVIVNEYGIFIIEVKNYNGQLVGSVGDYEWQKYHTTDAGNTYVKAVKNPIKQVKRQIYILSNYLKQHNINVWINGYVLLLHNNSPVDSEFILADVSDIDRVIHTQKVSLDCRTVESIIGLLSKSRNTL